MKTKRALVIRVISFILLLCMMNTLSITVSAAGNEKISQNKLLLTVGKKDYVSILNTKKKVKWSIKKGSNIISIYDSNNYTVCITAKKVGSAVVVGKLGSKKYKCNISVKKEKMIKLEKGSYSINSILPYPSDGSYDPDQAFEMKGDEKTVFTYKEIDQKKSEIYYKRADLSESFRESKRIRLIPGYSIVIDIYDGYLTYEETNAKKTCIIKRLETGMFDRYIAEPNKPVTIENMNPDNGSQFEAVTHYDLLGKDTSYIHFDNYCLGIEPWTSGLEINPERDIVYNGYTYIWDETLDKNDIKVVVRVDEGNAEIYIPTENRDLINVY